MAVVLLGVAAVVMALSPADEVLLLVELAAVAVLPVVITLFS